MLGVRTFDSVPLRLFATRADALAWVEQMTVSGETGAPAVQQKRGFLSLGPPGLKSRPVGVDLVPFVDGVPGPPEMVKCLQ